MDDEYIYHTPNTNSWKKNTIIFTRQSKVDDDIVPS